MSMPGDLASEARGHQSGMLAAFGWSPRALDHCRDDVLAAKQTSRPAPKLIWDQPPWHRWPPEVAASVSRALTRRRILHAALISELGCGDSKADVDDGADYRILPYRNERYGLSSDDFDRCRWIDLRLSPHRTDSGRFAYEPELVARWEATPDGQPLAGGSWIPAKSFPPDVESIDQLPSKVAQLRRLIDGPVIISIDAGVLTSSRDAILAGGPDVIFVRFGDHDIDGAALVDWAMKARTTCSALPAIHCWMHPPVGDAMAAFSSDDAAKLVALGVDGIAIDSWMEVALEAIDEIPPQSAYSHETAEHRQAVVDNIFVDTIDDAVDRFWGLCESNLADPGHLALGSFNHVLADRLGLQRLG